MKTCKCNYWDLPSFQEKIIGLTETLTDGWNNVWQGQSQPDLEEMPKTKDISINKKDVEYNKTVTVIKLGREACCSH